MARKQKSKRSSGNKEDRGDWHRFQKFKEENEKLRKEVSKLRKMVQDVLVDRLEKKQSRGDFDEPTKEPTCERCGNTDIKTITVPRPDGRFEIITCQSCKHRTELRRVKERK